MKSLTIAIPTFNRCFKLDKQIRFLIESQSKIDFRYDVLINDNDSTDDTKIICDNWIKLASQNGITIKYFKNDENIGLVRNVIKCFENSDTDLVWVIGDDDEIFFESFKNLLFEISDYKDNDYDFYHLNYQVTDGINGKLIREAFYDLKKEYVSVDDCLSDKLQIDAFMFITANIVSRKIILEAISTWSNGSIFLAFPLYFYMYSGITGNFKFFKEPVFNGIYNVGSWAKYASRVLFVEVPLMILKLKLKKKINKNISDRILTNYINIKQLVKEIIKNPQILYTVIKSLT